MERAYSEVCTRLEAILHEDADARARADTALVTLTTKYGYSRESARDLVGSLASLVGAIIGLLSAYKMVNEVKAVTRNSSFVWWHMLIPIYNYYWLWIVVPAEVKKAKQMLGVQAPPRSIVLYVFLWLFALASDINDMVR